MSSLQHMKGAQQTSHKKKNLMLQTVVKMHKMNLKNPRMLHFPAECTVAGN